MQRKPCSHRTTAARRTVPYTLPYLVRDGQAVRVVILVVLVRPRSNVSPLLLVVFAIARLCDRSQFPVPTSGGPVRGAYNAQHTDAAVHRGQLSVDQSLA